MSGLHNRRSKSPEKTKKGVKTLFRKQSAAKDFLLFLVSFVSYCKGKLLSLVRNIEASKNLFVKQLLWRRGMLSRPITHVSIIAFAVSVVFIGIVFGKTGVFSTSSAEARQTLVTKLAAPDTGAQDNVLAAAVDTTTEVSQKPRDMIITHTVQGGETISEIAQKYSIDTNTIRWANNLSDTDQIKPGDQLKILPVSGVSHLVASGDTVYSIADKYKANPQAIVDFPFNNIGEDLKVQVGQTVIVPDGVPPTKPAPAKPQRYIADATPVTPNPVSPTQKQDDRSNTQKQSTNLGFVWPVGGIITQYRTYYHTGIDIAGPIGTPVVAACSGTVSQALKQAIDYGWHVVVNCDNGYQTWYAHLSRIDVSVGQVLSAGEQLGLRGSTGRSTGPHTHFEVRKGSSILDPMTFLPAK